MISLVLEASTYAGSVALIDGARVLGERSVAMRGKEHEALMSAVGLLLDECDMRPGAIGRVICGAGPGSFTSLRIASAIAKGLCAASGAPLVPISSLALLVGVVPLHASGRYLATMDAMRGESYVQEFEIDAAGRISASGPQVVMSTAAVDQIATDRNAMAVGPAHSGAAHAVPHARAAVVITNLIEAASPADLAAWEPLYGRLAEAQVKWEADHGRALGVV